MELRTFVGPDLKETLARVKRELGPEAVILSTQSRRPAGGRHNWRLREIEVVAAVPPGSLPESGRPPEGDHSREGLSPLLSALHQELREVKSLLSRRLAEDPAPAWLQAYPEAAAFFHRLAAAGLSALVRGRWLAQVRPLLKGTRGPEQEQQAALQALRRLVPVSPGESAPPGGPRRVVLVGASGVGKTTTLAKLAIKAALVEGRRVGLISLDQERLGAVEQVGSFARLAGLPCQAATDRQELLRCLETLKDCEDIFIDTPGFNPCRPGLGEHLRRLLGGLPVVCHLLLPAPASEAHLALTLQAFATVSPATVILTKVDETQEVTGCVNQLCHRNLPVSYLTTGPRVPEDLEPASASRLAALVLTSRRPEAIWSRVPPSCEEVVLHAD
ncbi:MAG: hypothetical protein K6T55_10080 [Syntrophobacterales bacterium]|nr:hypothetical protein [Syntrophobacterales bacterium]